jgi:hypothetical protein
MALIAPVWTASAASRETNHFVREKLPCPWFIQSARPWELLKAVPPGWEGSIYPIPGTDLWFIRFSAEFNPEGGAYYRLGYRAFKISRERMKVRGWSPDFLESGDEVMDKVSSRSILLRMEKNTTKDPMHRVMENVATFGLTYGQFDQSALANAVKLGTSVKSGFELPEEESLKILLPRFLDSNGLGIAIELRSYSLLKDRTLTSSQRRATLVEGIGTALEIAQNYPELWDKPIIHTYADKKSLEMYGGLLDPAHGRPGDGVLNLGFRLVEGLVTPEKGIKAHATEWWPIWVSPKRLMQFLQEEHLFKPIHPKLDLDDLK